MEQLEDRTIKSAQKSLIIQIVNASVVSFILESYLYMDEPVQRPNLQQTDTCTDDGHKSNLFFVSFFFIVRHNKCSLTCIHKSQ